MKVKRKNTKEVEILFYTNKFVVYGKNRKTGKYKLEVKPPFLKSNIKLYSGNTKPLIKNLYLVSIFAVPLLFIAYILAVVALPFYIYITGAINFFTDSFYVDYVRTFHYTNIVAILIALIYLLLII